MNTTEIAERHVLPLVLAFAAGVLMMSIASQHREAHALALTARAITVAETYRDHCGEVFDAGRPLIATVTEPQR